MDFIDLLVQNKTFLKLFLDEIKYANIGGFRLQSYPLLRILLTLT